MSLIKDMLYKLTNAFNKNPQSNVGKLILITGEQIERITNTFYQIDAWRDIDKAEGKALDAIGRNFNVLRGKAKDETFRIMIRAKIARNNSDGTTNGMIQALSTSLNSNPKSIRMVDLWDEVEPAAIMIENIPREILDKAGITTDEFADMAQQVAAAGVKVYISASVMQEFLSLKGSVYTFPINFKITNRFRTGEDNWKYNNL